MQITKRDLNIMSYLNEYGVLSARAICILNNGDNLRSFTRRLTELYKYKYVSRWVMGNKESYLYGSGENSLFGDKYNFFNPKLFHEYILGEIMSYLYIHKQTDLKNIFTEYQYLAFESFANAEKFMIPDILLKKENIAIEFETTRKAKKRIYAKLDFYNRKYSQQFWVLNEYNDSIYLIIKDYINLKGIKNVSFIFLDNLMEELDEITKNNFLVTNESLFVIKKELYKKDLPKQISFLEKLERGY